MALESCLIIYYSAEGAIFDELRKSEVVRIP